MLDIIPDTHGQFAKLEALLRHLGYRERASAWRHPEPGRRVLFLGDYIDRGPQNRAVIATVRAMRDAGTAVAIMGNHELNALRFHARLLGAAEPLRLNTPKNIAQHRSFLDEFAGDPAGLRETLAFFVELPLWAEIDGLRAVHASWSEGDISALAALAPEGRLSAEQHIAIGAEDHPLYWTVERTLKGPEIRLPDGLSVTDKEGHARRDIRIAWWRRNADRLPETAVSLPEGAAVPDIPLPDGHGIAFYPEKAPNVVFGHYWLRGLPRVETANALCLDYSAGLDGTLVAYRMEDPNAPFAPDRIVFA